MHYDPKHNNISFRTCCTYKLCILFYSRAYQNLPPVPPENSHSPADQTSQLTLKIDKINGRNMNVGCEQVHNYFSDLHVFYSDNYRGFYQCLSEGIVEKERDRNREIERDGY